MKHAIPKSDILRGKKIFSFVFQHGRKIEGTFIRCYICPHPAVLPDQSPRYQVGFAVASRVRRAVDRNRMKRLLRESYRLQKELFRTAVEQTGTSLAIVFLYSVPTLYRRTLPAFHEVSEDMKTILSRIAARGTR